MKKTIIGYLLSCNVGSYEFQSFSSNLATAKRQLTELWKKSWEHDHFQGYDSWSYKRIEEEFGIRIIELYEGYTDAV